MSDDHVPDATRTFVAMLTAYVNGTPLDVAADISTMTKTTAGLTDLVYILGCAFGMLAHEIRLGCADAGISTDEYLAAIGPAAA